MKKWLFSVIVLLMATAMLCAVTPVKAEYFQIRGVNYPNKIFGTVQFDYYVTGVLEITIANTSSIQSALTAFAFNAPDCITGVDDFVGPNDGWKAIYDPNDINTPGNFGHFDIGAITGPNFSGGKPLNGLWTGEMATFWITLKGSGMDQLTVADFLNLESEIGNSGTPTEFIARYQAIGCRCDGSDVAIPSPVPVPGALFLLGPGLVGLVFSRVRKRIK
jgi:hypothetical protein